MKMFNLPAEVEFVLVCVVSAAFNVSANIWNLRASRNKTDLRIGS